MEQFYSRPWYARTTGVRPPDYCPPHPQWSLPPVCHQPQDLHQYGPPRMEHSIQPPAAHNHPHPSMYNKSYSSILSAEADFSKGLLNLRNVPDNCNHPPTSINSDGGIQIQRDQLQVQNLKLAHTGHLMTPTPLSLQLGLGGGGVDPNRLLTSASPPTNSSSSSSSHNKVDGASEKKKRSKKHQHHGGGNDTNSGSHHQNVPLNLPRRSSNFSNESFGSGQGSDEDDGGGGGGVPGKSRKRQKKKIILHGYITVLDGTPPMYQCNVCQKKFKTKAHVKYHEFCQKGEKPFKCEQCGQGFIVKGHYEYHMRTHTGEKPYTCSVCGKGFSQSGQVTRHMRSHSGEKPLRSHKNANSGDGGGGERNSEGND